MSHENEFSHSSSVIDLPRVHAGLTVDQMDREATALRKTSQFLKDLARPNGELIVSDSAPIDRFEYPILAREDEKRSARGVVLERISERGKEIEGLFDQTLTFPNPNGELSPDVLKNLSDHGLAFMPIPDFPVHSRKELEELVNGRNGNSRIPEVFTIDYLEAVLEGRLPYPDEYGSYKAVDSGGPVTELSQRLKIGNLHTASIVDTRAAIRENETKVLEDLGIDPKEAEIGVMTAKELRMKDALDGEDEKRVTATRIWGTEQHVAFDGKDMTTKSSTEPGLPRLAIVFARRGSRANSRLKPNHR